MYLLKNTLKIITLLTFLLVFANCKKNLKDAQSFSTPIDLNKITMEPMENAESSTLPVQKNSAGDYYIMLNLNYANSNINVVEAIKNGQILMHRIVVKNAKGEEIGWDTINFQAFNVEKITTISSPSNVIMTRDGKKVVQEQKSAEKINYTFNEVEYTDTDKIPQTIFFNNKYRPASDAWVSIYVEIIYVQPVIGEVCRLSSTGQSFDQTCIQLEKAVFEEIKKDNDKHIADLKSRMIENPDSLTRLQIPYKEVSGEPSVQAGPGIEDYNKMISTREYYSKSIEKAVQSLNDADRRINLDDDKLYFQEWRLVSVPRYFNLTRGRMIEAPRQFTFSLIPGQSSRLQFRITGAESRNSVLLARIMSSMEHQYSDYTVKIPVPSQNAASKYGLRIGQSVTLDIVVSKIDHKSKIIYTEPVRF